VLWFTCRREYLKCKISTCSWDDVVSEVHRQKKAKHRQNAEYWDRKVLKEESIATFLTAISTLLEDAPQIILVLYIFGCGNQQELLGKSVQRSRFSSCTGWYKKVSH